MNPTVSILRWRDVQPRVGISRSTAWRLQREGRFPRPVQLGRAAVGWRSDEIDAWISERRPTETNK